MCSLIDYYRFQISEISKFVSIWDNQLTTKTLKLSDQLYQVDKTLKMQSDGKAILYLTILNTDASNQDENLTQEASFNQSTVYYIKNMIFATLKHKDSFELLVKDAVSSWKRWDQKALAELIVVFL